MVEVFKYIDKFFTSLTNYLTYNYIFLIFVGLFLFTIFCVLISTSKAYESRLIKAIDKFNVYFIDNPHINEENLVAFNAKMKSKKVPKQLRKYWQQFVLYREVKASAYMSFENCVSNPLKNSTFKRDTRLMNVLAYIFSFCALLLNCYYCFESADVAAVLQSVLLTPVIILLLNYIFQIFLGLRHNAIVSDLYQNYQYFEVNIDKATETIPEYVDYEVLFDRNEIKKGIPILYAYLQKRAEEEQRELERARLKNVEHEKFNFDDQGIAAALVLERAMQEAENYIAERKKYTQDIGQINSDMTQEDMNYREITKEYNRQMQVSKETFANFKAQMEEVTSSIEANYLKKQQQQELDRQRNLERDFDTQTERHKKIIESYQAELDTVDKFIAQSRQNLEDAMKSEFNSYSSKVYDEAKKLAEERQKDKVEKLKATIIELEETIVSKDQELESAHKQNQEMSEKLEEVGIIINQTDEKSAKKSKRKDKEEVKETKLVQEAEPQKEDEQIQPIDEDEDEEPNDAPQTLSYEDYKKSILANNFKSAEETVEEPVQQEEIVEEPAQAAEDSTDEWLRRLNTLINENNEAENLEEANNDSVEELNNEDDYVRISTGENDYEEESLNDFEDEESEENISTDAEDDSIKEVKPVSRRGRPRKVVDASEEKGEKRKPGRPRKVQDETVQEVKRGRGRPKKVEEPLKKGPGRPKKAEVKEETLTKKGPGRPKKEDVQKPIKKGRGRPKKVVELKKGPGRPKKAEVKEETLTKKGPGRPKKEDVQKPIKKGRGRPKKVVELKKGPGRPKKEEVQETNKKGPGRPRKIESDLNDIKDIDAYLKEIDNAIAEENAKLEESQKELAKNARLRNRKK